MASKSNSALITKIKHNVIPFNTFVLTLFICLLTTPFLYSQTNEIQESQPEIDSVSTDSIKAKEPILLDIIKRNAKGYMKINKKENKLYLYDQAELYYQNTELKAGIIVLDYNTNIVAAGRIKDSTGAYTQYPVFKQGGDEVNPDSLRFNFDTKKALIWNSRSEQNGMNVISEKTKKENDSVYYIGNAKVTTAKDLEDPEYHIRVRNGKFIPGKKIIAGPSNLYLAGIPTPVVLPFAYFPLTKDRATGFIFPTIGQNNNRGYFFQNGGYYFVFSDYFDIALLGDYYTNGSYGFRSETTYKRRYKYQGNLSFRFENLINGERGLSGYSKSNIYNIRWSHSQDSKSNPNSRFSASVNLGSSNYYSQSVNQLNTPNFLNNTLSSSVSYSKTFAGYPSVNLSLSASHSQNTNTQKINMTLPTFQANVERIYPFAKRDGIKKGIIENINFQYSVRGENRIETTDSLFFKKEMFEDARSGMKHSIPINTNVKLLKHFSLSLGGNYSESWTNQTILRNDYDNIKNEVGKIDTLKGFDRFGEYNFSASLGTTVYGTFNFKEGKKIQSIRHVIRPSVSYGVSPSFEQYYDEYIINAEGETREYTRFEGGINGVPSNRYSSSIGISVSNNFEAKVVDKDSTKTEPKKIKLLNNLNFSTSYNISADSLRWSPVRMTTGTTLFNNKMNLNVGATFDPYAIDDDGGRINTFNVDDGGGLFRMTSANVNVGYSFSSKDFKENSSDNKGFDNSRSGGRDDDLFGTETDFSDSSYYNDDDENEDKKDDTEFYRYSLPWDIRVAYSMTYSNSVNQREISNNSLMLSGNVELSPKWKVGGSSGYDFKNRGVTYTQLRFERDLDSWRMSFSWVPFSTRTSWYFFIGVKSSILSDLKHDKRREPRKRL